MKLVDKNIIIRTIVESDISNLWEVAYRDNLEWTKWDGPYFNDPIYSKEEYLNNIAPKYYLNKDNKGLILYDTNIVGIITYSFEDGKLKQWIEFGLVIFDDNYWGKGIGSRSCSLWIDYIFTKYPKLPHIGFTTWSGNERMMGLGLKIGMTLEARIRQVRYYDNKYWDSIKYGILRDEFY